MSVHGYKDDTKPDVERCRVQTGRDEGRKGKAQFSLELCP